MKTLLLLTAAAILATSAEGANRNNRNKWLQEQAKKEEARKKKEKAEREHRRNGIEKFLEPRDANKDGSLTKDEFLSGEQDKEEGAKRFDKFNKNGDRFLAKSEIQDMLGL